MEISLEETRLMKIALKTAIYNCENNIKRENLKQIDIQTVVTVEAMKALLEKLQNESVI